MMLTIRGVYDGLTFRPLPSERVPEVDHEVPIAIVFLEETVNGNPDVKLQAEEAPHPRPAREWEAAMSLLAAREKMEPLKESVKDLIEEGRER
jgi:hypothetical protein